MRALAEGLAERGITVEVVTTDDNGPERLHVPLGTPVKERRVVYRYFPRQTSFYNSSAPLSHWLWQHTREFSVVHIHALFSYSSTAAAWIARAKSVPYVVRPLGILNHWGMRNRRPWLKRCSFELLERRILNHAAAVQYTTRQEQLEAESLGFHAPAAVIPNPVGVGAVSAPGAFRARYPELRGKLVILFLSRLDQKKGLDLLLPAFRRLLDSVPDAKLVIAGEGAPNLVSKLRSRAAQLGLTDQVLWTGFVEGAEKWSMLAESDLSVLPSYSENFGIAAVEAMHFGLPVIVSDQVGLHSDIALHDAGLVVACKVEALTDALSRLAGDPQMRTAMGERGRRLAATRYSIEAVSRAMTDLYEGIMRT